MSDFFMPERSNSFSVTSTGPVSIIAGSEPILVKARIFARGFRPCFAPASLLPSRTAPAPPRVPDEEPARTPSPHRKQTRSTAHTGTAARPAQQPIEHRTLITYRL